MKILFVGMNPGTYSPHIKKHSTIWRINRWVESAGVKHYSFVNVFALPGNFKAHQVDTDFLLGVILLHHGPVVALGNVSATVLSRMNVRYEKFPHPSFRNRKLNDRDFEARVVGRIRELHACESWSPVREVT